MLGNVLNPFHALSPQMKSLKLREVLNDLSKRHMVREQWEVSPGCLMLKAELLTTALHFLWARHFCMSLVSV